MSVGLHAIASLEHGRLCLFVIVDRAGHMSAAEKAARDVIVAHEETSTPEMDATTVERLAGLIPLECADGDELKEAAELVAALRKVAVLS